MADGTSPIVLLSGYANGPGLAHLVLTLRCVMEKTGRTTGPWICASHSFLSRGRLDAQVCSRWASAERGLVVFEFEGPSLYFEISSYRSVMMIHKAAILFFSWGQSWLRKWRRKRTISYNVLGVTRIPMRIPFPFHGLWIWIYFLWTFFVFFYFCQNAGWEEEKEKTKGIIHSNKW